MSTLLHILLLIVSSLGSSTIVNQPQVVIPALSETPSALGESQFTNCGTTEDFAKETWYASLISEAEKATYYTQEDAIRMWEMNKESISAPQEALSKYGYVSPEVIHMICYAENTKLAIFTASEYMITGKIFVYSVANNSLSALPFLSQPHNYDSFMKFGTQEGFLLPVSRNFGDGPASSETIYNINLKDVTLTPIKSKNCIYNEESQEAECEEQDL